MIKVKKIEYVSGYKLKILFSDGKLKVVDFEDWINEGGAYILPLKSLDYFKKVRMDKFNYTICWPNGADFCPDSLYAIGKDVKNKILPKRPIKRPVSRSRRKIFKTS